MLYLRAAGPAADAPSQCTGSRTDWPHTAQKRLRAWLFLCTARTCFPHPDAPDHLNAEAPFSLPGPIHRASQEEASLSGCLSPGYAGKASRTKKRLARNSGLVLKNVSASTRLQFGSAWGGNSSTRP